MTLHSHSVGHQLLHSPSQAGGVHHRASWVPMTAHFPTEAAMGLYPPTFTSGLWVCKSHSHLNGLAPSLSAVDGLHHFLGHVLFLSPSFGTQPTLPS